MIPRGFYQGRLGRTRHGWHSWRGLKRLYFWRSANSSIASLWGAFSAIQSSRLKILTLYHLINWYLKPNKIINYKLFFKIFKLSQMAKVASKKGKQNHHNLIMHPQPRGSEDKDLWGPSPVGGLTSQLHGHTLGLGSWEQAPPSGRSIPILIIVK